jgi:hypothetical protein
MDRKQDVVPAHEPGRDRARGIPSDTPAALPSFVGHSDVAQPPAAAVGVSALGPVLGAALERRVGEALASVLSEGVTLAARGADGAAYDAAFAAGVAVIEAIVPGARLSVSRLAPHLRAAVRAALDMGRAARVAHERVVVDGEAPTSDAPWGFRAATVPPAPEWVARQARGLLEGIAIALELAED